MTPVIIESPYKGDNSWADLDRNRTYLERCIRDCVTRGESPYASHKMLTVAFDDTNPEERRLGIAAGLVWRRLAANRIFFVDYGVSDGMAKSRQLYEEEGLPFEIRKIGVNP